MTVPPQQNPMPNDPNQPYGSPGAPYPGAMPPPPQPRRNWFARHKIMTTLLAVVAVIIVISALASGGDTLETAEVASSASDSSKEPVEKEEPAEEKEPEESVAKIWDTVRGGDLEFVIKKVTCGKTKVGSKYANKKAQGQFCFVTLTISNVGKEPSLFFEDNVTLYDDQDREFAADTEASIYHEPDATIFLEEINPGNTLKGDVVFDIPDDAKPARLELQDSFWSGAVVVQLG